MQSKSLNSRSVPICTVFVPYSFYMPSTSNELFHDMLSELVDSLFEVNFLCCHTKNVSIICKYNMRNIVPALPGIKIMRELVLPHLSYAEIENSAWR